MGTYTSEVQKLYIAYFNRPADPAGLAYWEGQLASGVSMATVQNGFSSSAEYQAIYTGKANLVLIDTLYQNLFGRSSDAAGLLWWAGEITAGRQTITSIAGALASGTTPGTPDNVAITSKITAASSFTDGLVTTAQIIGYTNASAYATASAWLAPVTDTTTLATASASLTTTIASAVTAGSSSTGSTFTLTTAADTGASFTGGSGADTFVATLASPGETNDSSTLTAGDALTGGSGVDTLNVTVGGSAITATTAAPILSGIEKLLVSNQEADAGDNVTFDLTSASGLTHLGTTASVLNGDTFFTNVGSAVALQMAGSGDLTVKFADTVVSATTDSVTVTLNGVTGGAALTLDNQTGSEGAFETVNLVSSTSANNVALTDVDATTVAISGDKALTLSVAGATAVTTVNAATLTAALTLSGDAAAAVSIVGGTANDALTIGNFGSTDTVNGGDGTDTLNVDNAITASTMLANVSNVEVLATTGIIDVTLAANVAGLTTIDTTTGASANNVTFSSGYTAATTVKADATDVIDNSGANAAISVNFSSDDAVTVTGGTGTDTLNITASSSAVTFAAAITVVDTVTVVDNGDATSGATGLAGEDITLTLGAYDTALTIDASALEAGTLAADGSMDANWENLTVSGASATKALNVTGGAGADSITGGTANDVINGGAGNDVITGSAGGSDSINGGAGNDTIDMAGALTSADTINGGDGTDTLSVTSLSASGLTNVTNVETLSLSGTGSAATLSANLSFTTIDMAAVDDLAQTLTLSTGYTNATTVAVDAGDKVLNSANVAMTVTANAADLQAADVTTITGGSGTDTLTVKADNTTANIVATSGLITLVDAIVVTDGGDVTSGTITAGKDITIDLASYNTALSIDASALDAGTIVSDVLTNDEVLTITGTASKALTVTGGGGADVIVGSTANDSLSGGAGNDTFTMSTNLTYQDTIVGGSGTDTLTTGAITDVAFMHVSGIETVTLASTATFGTYFDASGATKVNLHTAAAAVDASTTSTGHNFVAKADGAGTAVNNNITGGMGNDTFTFGDGGTTADDLDTSEVIAGGDGTDTVVISNALASVTAVLDLDDVTAVETIQLGTASGLASTSTETIALTVEAIGTVTTAQTITIDASVITDSDDTVAITNSAGTSTHATKFSITGGAGADTLAGSYLADTISGGAGADSITGNLGADSLTGGEGADVFVFAATNGGTNDSKGTTADTVSDFVSGTDQLVLAINGGGAAAGNVAYLGEFASNIDALSSLSSKVGEYFFNTTTKQLVMDIDGNGLIQADDLSITLTGATKINAGDVAISLTNVTAQTIVATAGDDTFNFAGNTDLAAATLDGLAGTDTINIVAVATDIVDASFDGFSNIETLTLTGASEIVVGTNADAAGLATGHGTIITGAGATKITAASSKHFTVNAAAIVDGTALTLVDSGTSNFVVTGLKGDIVTDALAGTLTITTAAVATTSIDVATGATTIGGLATAAAVAANDLADGSLLTLSGATSYTVTALSGDLTSTSTGDLAVTMADVLTSTVAFGTSTAGTHSVDADLLTDGDVLTLTGSDAASVSLTAGDLTASGYLGALTIVATTGSNVITTGAAAADITGGAAADTITLGAANGVTDTIRFAATLNGADTIANFLVGATNGDLLDVDAIVTGGAYNTLTPVADGSAGNIALAGLDNKVVFVSTGDVSADFSVEATLFAAGEFAVEGTTAYEFILVVGETAGTDGVKMYQVVDGTGADDMAITLIGTLSGISLAGLVATNFDMA